MSQMSKGMVIVKGIGMRIGTSGEGERQEVRMGDGMGEYGIKGHAENVAGRVGK